MEYRVFSGKIALRLDVGDEILITGPTTGALFSTVEEIRVDLKPVQQTVKGEHFSIKTERKIRPSDKLYKWVDTTRSEDIQSTQKPK